MRCSSDLAEPGWRVLLTGASRPGSAGHYHTGFVHGTDGDYGCGHDEDSKGDGALGGLYSKDKPYAHYPDDVTYGVLAG